MRRSFDRAAGRSPLHVVTAFAAEARMVVGQVAAGDKESEIIAARILLGLIDIKGALVTGDALHCQGETARLITEQRRDWLFTLKGNRPLQHAETAALFGPAQSVDSTLQSTASRLQVDQNPRSIEEKRLWELGFPFAMEDSDTNRKVMEPVKISDRS